MATALPSMTATGIAAAAASGVGLGLFNYNRTNFRFDATLRFERFQSQREWAIGQQNQYRNDIRKLTELTVKKMSSYHMTGCLIIAVNIALFCAGRLGLHGPSPPGWIMGLFLTNNAVSLCFLMIAAWMAMQASQRCAAASTSLLTRQIRVPVPTKKDLDQARKLSSDFEQASWHDIFRLPYVMGGSESIPNVDYEADGHGGGRSRSAPPPRRATKTTPGWYQEEWVEDKGLLGGAASASGECPEHFQDYAALQEEWYQQECYVRMCLLFGCCHFISALAYYGLGHINVELRAFWAAYACPGVLCLAHALLLSHDIVPGNKKDEKLMYFEYLGPLAVLPAAIGMSLEFRVKFDPNIVNLAWAFIILSYLMHILYCIRLHEIIAPEQVHVVEQLGDVWWPKHWKVPAAIKDVCFLVAPPRRLLPGQVDLVQETKLGVSGALSGASVRSAEALAERCEMIFEAFDQEEVRSTISSKSKTELRTLNQEFSSAKASGASAAIFRAIVTNLERVAEAENFEMDASITGDVDTTQRKPQRTGIGRGPLASPPVVVGAIVKALIVAWSVMLLGVIIEAFMGEQVFVTAPHWARPPMTRPSKETWELGAPLGGDNYAGYREWLPEHMEWYDEERCANESMAVALGVEAYSHERYGPHCKNLWRRLQTFGRRKVHEPKDEAKRHAFAASLQDLVSALPSHDVLSALLRREPTDHEDKALGDALATFSNRATSSTSRGRVIWHQPAGPEFVSVDLTWPRFFEPKVIACSPGGGIAALTPRGAGAALRFGSSEMEAFSLTGLLELAPLLAASWDNDALLVVTRAGELARCAGPHAQSGGQRLCSPLEDLPETLPMAQGETLLAATTGWLRLREERQFFAAVVTASSPELAAIYVAEVEDDEAQWVPFGDVPLPRAQRGNRAAAAMSLSFVGDGDLLMALEDGAFLRRSLADGATVSSTKALHPWRAGSGAAGARAGGAAWWQGACSFGTQVAQLSLRHQAIGAWKPELAIAEIDKPELIFN